MADFNPDAYLAGSGPAPAAAPTPVDQTQLNQFDPDDYLSTKANSEYAGLQNKYGGLGGELEAGLAGAARGASLGTSDLLLTKTGLVSPETLKGLKEANPISSFAGNTLGGGALIGATGGVAAPLEEGILGVDAASVAAKASAEAVAAGSSEEAANIIGQKAAQAAITTAQNTAGQAASYGARAVGWGVEGGAFGLGNTVSDYALGDPNISASKVLSDVGMGVLFGAGAGVLTKGIGQGISALGEKSGLFTKKLADVADSANAKAETANALSGSESGTSGGGGAPLAEGEKGPLFSLTPVDKAAAPELRRIVSENPELTLNNGMTSGIKSVQQATDVLASGAPTIANRIVQGELEKGWNGATDIIENKVLNSQSSGMDGGPMTAKQLGDGLVESLKSSIAEDNAPVAKAFADAQARGENIPIDRSAVQNVLNDLSNNKTLKFGGSDAKIISNVADTLTKINSAEELQNYQTFLKGEYPFLTSTQNEKFILGQLHDKLQSIFESSVENNSGDPELIAASKAAKAQSAAFKQKFDPVMEQLGGKTGSGYGASYMRNFIDELDPEKLAAKLFDKKYSSFNQHFAENFPEQAGIMRQYMKQTLRQKSLFENGQLDPRALFKQVFGLKGSPGLEPEIRAQIFSPDELSKLQDMKTYISNFPKKFNPSGTEGAIDFRAGFTPTGAAIANARDFAILAYIKAAGREPGVNGFELGAQMADKFNKMNAVNELNQNFNQRMVSKVKGILNSQGTEDAARGALLSSQGQGIDKGYDKVTKNITTLAANPSAFMQHIAQSTDGLNNALPNVTQSLASKSTVALQFLNSKIPKPTTNLPLNQPFEPSDFQKKAFMKSYTAVNDPLSVLDQVKNGTVSNESLEALKAVHPEVLQQMQNYVSAHLTTKNGSVNLPYVKKIAIAKFLGQPLDQNMLPQVIQANQMALQGPQQSQQGAQKQGRGHTSALAKADFAGRASSETQRLETQKD